MAEEILQITKLTKHFGHVKAVQELDLTVRAGQVFGLLGPNGSGKTTTLGMILGVINPTSGSFTWYGKKPTYKVRQQIGAILEHPIFFPHLSAVQNLRIAAEIKEVKPTRIDEVLDWVGLAERKNDIAAGYSLGMKQRLAIASALLSDPQVLILDEPTNGLDPLGIADIRGLIQRIAAEGKTIILASHLLDEVQKVCTDFCVLKKGMLIHSGNVEEELSRGQYFEVTATDFEKLQAALLAHPATLLSELKPEFVRLQSTASGEEINRYLIENGIIISGLAAKKMTLENQFINLVSNGG
jgi:ABC-2 type transport system ATP-binding protein